MRSTLSLVGRRFGRRVVLKQAPHAGFRHMWIVRCDCGAVSTVAGIALQAGRSLSCGCITREKSAKRIAKQNHERRVHGHTVPVSPTYKSWRGMHIRCTQPNSIGWHRYGGRGITVCKRWRVFANFLADMGVRPKGMTLDRRDNDGNYTPGNCRWATPKEQQRHRSKS